MLIRSPAFECLPYVEEQWILQSKIDARLRYKVSSEVCCAWKSLPLHPDLLGGACATVDPHTASRVGIPDVVMTKLLAMGCVERYQPASGHYTAVMVEAYLKERRTPVQLAECIVAQASITRTSRVLDVAAGTGSLAIDLSFVSDYVHGIDISSDFIREARKQSMLSSASATFSLAAKGNVFGGLGQYDVVTVCQAMHWLRLEQITDALPLILSPTGTLILVESKPFLDGHHPLALRFNYGLRTREEATAACYQHGASHRELFDHCQRTAGLFRDCQVSIVEEAREFGVGFARALLFDDQITAAYADSAQPWKDLENDITRFRSDSKSCGIMWSIISLRRQMLVGRHCEAATEPLR